MEHSVKSLIAASRTSGPGLVFTPNADGELRFSHFLPARSPFKGKTLTREEELSVFVQTGTWPEHIAAASICGVQPSDCDSRYLPPASMPVAERAVLSQRQELDAVQTGVALEHSGVMQGYADDNA